MAQHNADRYAYLASETAGRWAERVLVGQHEDIELQTVAAVVLDLRAQVAELRTRVKDAERLAFNLGGDLLYTLEAHMQQETGAEQEYDLQPVGYAARGWMRDSDRIDLATSSEGQQVTQWLESLQADHFARQPLTDPQ